MKILTLRETAPLLPRLSEFYQIHQLTRCPTTEHDGRINGVSENDVFSPDRLNRPT